MGNKLPTGGASTEEAIELTGPEGGLLAGKAAEIIGGLQHLHDDLKARDRKSHQPDGSPQDQKGRDRKRRGDITRLTDFRYGIDSKLVSQLTSNVPASTAPVLRAILEGKTVTNIDNTHALARELSTIAHEASGQFDIPEHQLYSNLLLLMGNTIGYQRGSEVMELMDRERSQLIEQETKHDGMRRRPGRTDSKDRKFDLGDPDDPDRRPISDGNQGRDPIEAEERKDRRSRWARIIARLKDTGQLQLVGGSILLIGGLTRQVKFDDPTGSVKPPSDDGSGDVDRPDDRPGDAGGSNNDGGDDFDDATERSDAPGDATGDATEDNNNDATEKNNRKGHGGNTAGDDPDRHQTTGHGQLGPTIHTDPAPVPDRGFTTERVNVRLRRQFRPQIPRERLPIDDDQTLEEDDIFFYDWKDLTKAELMPDIAKYEAERHKIRFKKPLINPIPKEVGKEEKQRLRDLKLKSKDQPIHFQTNPYDVSWIDRTPDTLPYRDVLDPYRPHRGWV